MSLSVEEESESVKQAAEEILRAGETYKPTIKFYTHDKLKGEITIRNVESDADKNAAFAEACMLIPYLRSDEIVLTFDDFISTKPGLVGTEDPDSNEAICVVIANSIGAMVVIMPYMRDEHGNFSHWGQRQDDASPTELNNNLIYTLAHFIQYKSPAPKYPHVLADTLKNRGHQVTLHRVKEKEGSRFMPV